ncbi:MAG: DUF4238 domain-containing protein [Promethearchaeota archaeon]
MSHKKGIRQHYVPVGYLKFFSICPKRPRKKLQIWRSESINRIENKIKPRKIHIPKKPKKIVRVAHEKHFLEKEVDEELKKLENDILRYIQDIIDTKEVKNKSVTLLIGNLPLKDDKFPLFLYIGCQALRTCYWRNLLAPFYNYSQEDLKKKQSQQFLPLIRNSAPIYLPEWGIPEGFNLDGDRLDDFSHRLIIHTELILLINRTEMNFITSDNPVVWIDDIDLEIDKALKPHILFPLSPKIAILLALKTDKIPNKICIINNPHNILKCNIRIWEECEKEIYAYQKNDLVTLKEHRIKKKISSKF